MRALLQFIGDMIVAFDPPPDEEPARHALVERQDRIVTWQELEPLSLIEVERQTVDIRRQEYTRDIEDFEAAIAFHRSEIARNEADITRFEAKRAEARRILASLERHASDISDPPMPPGDVVLGDVFVDLVETPSGAPVAQAAE